MAAKQPAVKFDLRCFVADFVLLPSSEELRIRLTTSNEKER